VKHLVGLHGGDVAADNRPRGGALFTVRLPASP
jgi:signal transduction histidine kinase